MGTWEPFDFLKHSTKGKRYCARCNTLREYTEEPRTDGGFNQFCIVCGCIVGMRYPVEENEPWVVDPYQDDNGDPMTLDQYMHMKGIRNGKI